MGKPWVKFKIEKLVSSNSLKKSKSKNWLIQEKFKPKKIRGFLLVFIKKLEMNCQFLTCSLTY
jgi:hypothetical protein